jgi:transcriptional regulator with XRE-family HTH domain
MGFGASRCYGRAVSVASPAPSVGALLRDWRQRRRLSQLDLAVEAEVSTRHLSFVETGRSRPSRDFLLHLAEHLGVPLRERNALLLAGGFAPTYRQTPLDAAEMAPVREAVDKILAGHQPFPAVVVDRRWDLVSANRAARAVLSEGVAPELLTPPVNTLRVSLHPDGLAPRIANLAEYSSHLLTRLRRQAAVSGDPDLVALGDELRGYPGVADAAGTAVEPAALLFMPLTIRSGGRELTFFSTLATFGTALDVTMAELCIEAFFPADPATAAALHDAPD